MAPRTTHHMGVADPQVDRTQQLAERVKPTQYTGAVVTKALVNCSQKKATEGKSDFFKALLTF